MEYRFLVEHATIENAIFPYKTVLPKASVKINIIRRIQNGPITKNGVLPLIAFIFLKI